MLTPAGEDRQCLKRFSLEDFFIFRNFLIGARTIFVRILRTKAFDFLLCFRSTLEFRLLFSHNLRFYFLTLNGIIEYG